MMANLNQDLKTYFIEKHKIIVCSLFKDAFSSSYYIAEVLKLWGGVGRPPPPPPRETPGVRGGGARCLFVRNIYF
jgi:hypothetical protein